MYARTCSGVAAVPSLRSASIAISAGSQAKLYGKSGRIPAAVKTS